MKPVINSFMQMLLMVKHDLMLLASCIAPILAGLVFKFGIPVLEKVISGIIGNEFTLDSYYSLFDSALAVITPILFCFAAAMIVLEERDEKITKSLVVTSLGEKGYLISRFVIPAGFANVFTLVLLPFFCMGEVTIIKIICLSVSGTLVGLIVALMVVTFSSNKLEGMAVTKFSTLTAIGFVIPYFVSDKVQYVLSFIPSFWLGQVIYNNNVVYMIPTLLCSFIWIILFYRILKSKW